MKRTTVTTTESPDILAVESARQDEPSSSVPESMPSNSKNRPTKPSSKFKNPAGNPSAVDFERLGIKVKDFAYEKTNLPPVKTIYRHPRQVQPSVPRQLTDPDISQPQSQGLYRTTTEPVLPPEADEGNQVEERLSQRVQSALALLAPQDSEMSSLTPLSTLNASQNWDIQDTSQCDNIASTCNKKSPATQTMSPSSTRTSPLTPLSSSPAVTPTYSSQSSHRQHTSSGHRSNAVVPKLSARYFLRKRSSPSPNAPAKPAKRSRRIATAELPKQHPLPTVTIQSSHNQSKSKNGTASPNAVIPRRTSARTCKSKRKSSD